MAGHPEETPLPPEVVALLGADIVDRSGAGACRVVSGGGLVARIGPADVIVREAAVLRTALPLSVPTVVDQGPGWIVVVAESDADGPWPDNELDGAVGELAALHDAFEATIPDGLTQVLRRPFTAEGADQLLEPVRALQFPLAAPLDRLLHEPAPLLEAATAEPATLLHGDPWPGNILRPATGPRVWIDWELASIGPAAADLASWINQAPWHAAAAGSSSARPPERDITVYLQGRCGSVADRDRFERVLDAATVLWFLAHDVPRLAAGAAAPDVGETLTARVLAALDRLERR
jgi:hypothetical protein